MKVSEAITHLKAEQRVTDKTIAHARADDVLCAFLRSMNFGQIVDEWEQIVRPDLVPNVEHHARREAT